MHIWAALTGVGATLGRRVYLPFGIADIYPNMYVLLVGPPGTRKSTAINIVEALVKKATNVRFAPDDTAGQRQGLIIEMENKQETASDDDIAQLDAAIAALDIGKLSDIDLNIDGRDAHCLFAVADEFSSFIGHNAIDLCTFLNKVFDGKDFEYKIRSIQHTLKAPLLSILGGTTTKSINDTLPPAVIGHGFSSRIVFVYANKKYRSIARPRPLDRKLEQELCSTFKRLSTDTDGVISEDTKASKLIEDLYKVEVELNDPRFIYYIERRQQHLLKVAIILMAARGSLHLTTDDILEAHELLSYTEKFMPDALGEFGMTKIGASKQKMVEFLQSIKRPMTEDILWAIMSKDLARVDFLNALMDLTNSGKIVRMTSPRIGNAYMYNDTKQVELEETLNTMVEEAVSSGSVDETNSSIVELKRG